MNFSFSPRHYRLLRMIRRPIREADQPKWFDRTSALLVRVGWLVIVLGLLGYLRWLALSAEPTVGELSQEIIGRWEATEDEPLVIEFAPDGQMRVEWKGVPAYVGRYRFLTRHEIGVTYLRTLPDELPVPEDPWSRFSLRFAVAVTAEGLSITESSTRERALRFGTISVPPRSGDILRFRRGIG